MDDATLVGWLPVYAASLWAIIWLVSAVIIVAMGVYGALMMNSVSMAKLRTGSTLVLIASIIVVPTMWGFMIGSLLMFIGSLLGLTWMPTRAQTAQQS